MARLLAAWALEFGAASGASNFLTTTEVAKAVASWTTDCATEIEMDFTLTRSSVKATLERLYLEQTTLGALS